MSVRMNPSLVVQDTHVVAALIMNPESIRRYLLLFEGILGAVKEGILISEGSDAKGAIS
jgi:hypothetical protein